MGDAVAKQLAGGYREAGERTKRKKSRTKKTNFPNDRIGKSWVHRAKGIIEARRVALDGGRGQAARAQDANLLP